MYSQFLKPILDVLISLIGLFLLSPILLLVILLLVIANKGKLFFFQSRPGKSGKIFRIVKFKTMKDRRDMDGNLLSDAERLTPIGSFVRKALLDEIPQLINVLKGDMSLVGPRPLLVEYLPLYSKEQSSHHEVRPVPDGPRSMVAMPSTGNRNMLMKCGMLTISRLRWM